MSELVDLISDGQMDGRQSVGGQTTDVIDVNGLSRPIGVTIMFFLCFCFEIALSIAVQYIKFFGS